jgi:hypothetical protein
MVASAAAPPGWHGVGLREDLPDRCRVSTENREVVGVTDGVGGNWRGRDDLATSPEFRDGCVDPVGGAIEPAQAMLEKLAQDVLGQNQLYRRRQETVSQQLLANARSIARSMAPPHRSCG